MDVTIILTLARLKTLATQIRIGNFFVRRKARKELLNILDPKTIEEINQLAEIGYRKEVVNNIVENLKK